MNMIINYVSLHAPRVEKLGKNGKIVTVKLENKTNHDNNY